MIGFKKRDTKDLFKTVACAHGISVAESRAEMQATIDEARSNPDPRKQAEFKKHFENKIHTSKNLFII